MRDLFPGFYERTEEELSECWREGIFVFDTNMLLNVYRYTAKARERYFEVLDLLKNRNQLWIPYQVAFEYLGSRMDVIQRQLKAYDEVHNILHTTEQNLETSLGTYKRKHGFIDAEKLTLELTDPIKRAKAAITQAKEKDKKAYEALKRDDNLLEKLESVFHGNIGTPYTSSKLEEVYRRGQLRIELRIPPGWEDEGKNTFKAYGDLVLWFQLLDFTRMQKKPIVFVTDDGKKDWWIRDARGKPIRPLPTLVQELFVDTSVLLHMYQGYEFLEQAERFLNLEAKPDVVEEAKEITEQNTGNSSYLLAENAVQRWLRVTYPQFEMIVQPGESQASGVDILLMGRDGIRVGAVLKYRKAFFYHKDLEELLTLANDPYIGQTYDKFVMILICEDEARAKDLRTHLPGLLSLPTNSSIVIGYLTPKKHFLCGQQYLLNQEPNTISMR